MDRNEFELSPWRGSEMQERIVRTTIQILASALAFIISLAPMSAVAAPMQGASALLKARQLGPYKPTVMVHQDSLREFEELTGSSLSSSDLSNLQRIVGTVDDLNSDLKPQRGLVHSVRWDLGNTGYEFTVLVCGHLRTDVNKLIPKKALDALGKVPPFFRDKIKGTINRANVDILPCWDPHTGISYVMFGIGGTTTGESALTTGVSIGIYFAPKSEKMVVGDYVFGRASMSFGGLVSWDAVTAGGDLRCAQGVWNVVSEFKVDFSQCSRAFISTGLSLDLGGAIIAKLKQWKNGGGVSTGNGVAVTLGTWTFSGGVVVKMHEFPWYQRLRSGMGYKETFADIDQYIVAAGQ